VAETTVKRLLCCGFRRNGKAIRQVHQSWWRIYREINDFSRFKYRMFYVLYPFVTYLLTLPLNFSPEFSFRTERFTLIWVTITGWLFTMLQTVSNAVLRNTTFNSSLSNCLYSGFDVFRNVAMKRTVFWVLTPCSLVECHRILGGAYWSHFRNEGEDKLATSVMQPWVICGHVACLDSTLKLEAMGLPETSVNDQTAWQYIPEYSSLQLIMHISHFWTTWRKYTRALRVVCSMWNMRCFLWSFCSTENSILQSQYLISHDETVNSLSEY
jgi:hypothetical protein